MTSSTCALICGLIASSAMTACSHSRVDASWGESSGHTLRAQVDSQLPGPRGLDAPTAERVTARYYRGQEGQQTRQAQTIVIGTSN